MAYCRLSNHRAHAFWRDLQVLHGCLRTGPEAGSMIQCSCSLTRFNHSPVTLLSQRAYSMQPILPKLDSSNTAERLSSPYDLQKSSANEKSVQFEETDSSKLRKSESNVDPLNNRVMLVDGTAIMYRSYYKLLAKLRHGQLEHADGNGDWVLTIFTALSFLLDVLEFVPSHVAVVFDHDGKMYT
ncbi:hypothetical protein Cni_G11771 [Canna indica]|uniref:5'-3' exonuclease alpha-helical arch N-terminal domain-containing protein n=1 Tax=Canna indica TaxID=4628 RepID=A0AAQ3Q8F9_9LILI|nr:hypothetical protein Cni_G11771 [Canna indica]